MAALVQVEVRVAAAYVYSLLNSSSEPVCLTIQDFGALPVDGMAR